MGATGPAHGKRRLFQLVQPGRAPLDRDLREIDTVLARKDPPVESQFIYDTMVLEAAQRGGVQVANDPQALRDCNEKLFALQFPQCMAPTLVARDATDIRRFVTEHGDAVLKPLDGMGGRGIFRVKAGDKNLNSMLETLIGGGAHGEGRQFAMAQKFIPQISAGDKRILLIDGEPVPYALARIPQGDEFPRQPCRRWSRRRRSAERSRSLDRRRSRARTASSWATFCRPGCHRRLPDRDQRHIADVRA